MANKDNQREHSTVDADDAWVTAMRQKLEASSSKPGNKDQHSIYRVPKHIYETDENTYEPKIISIGPFHKGKRCLKDMEEHKWRYLNVILSRNRDLSLENYLAEIKKIEMQARSCYSESMDHLESNEFIKMMVVDGCFIVQLFLKYKEAVKEKKKGGFEADPIYDKKWMLPLVTHDMLLLENQIPFFVLQSLFELVDKSSNPSSLSQIALDFFDHLLSRNNEIHHDPKKVYHLLHLFHSSLLPSKKSHKICSCFCCMPTNRSPESSNKGLPTPLMSIPTATELKNARMKFKQKKMKRGSFLDVNFSKGAMEIPHLLIYESTNYLFRNLIAWELCFRISGAHFTSYTFLMDCLINTPNDVAILKRKKIIEHTLANDEEVALVFNQVRKRVDFENYYLSLFKDVNKYYERKHVWRVVCCCLCSVCCCLCNVCQYCFPILV
ncbi:UPF0481 protein At3g47200-like [Tasmannia lanceolata]|uniref:UPF0481 protein At3g47200-like n=1 Tax=Tasmannia lanceolata TaxID=3420 RepID=UPI004063D04D